MESQIQPADSYLAQDYAKKFFKQVPTDSRFLEVSYVKFSPSTAVDADTINFDLNKFDAANIYQIQDSCLEVCCKIVKADGISLPGIINIKYFEPSRSSMLT